MDSRPINDDTALFAAARVARDFALLPGAPLPDWCDQAAAVLVRASAGTLAAVAVISSGVGPPSIERAGFAAPGCDPGGSIPLLKRLIRAVAARPECLRGPVVQPLARLASGGSTRGDRLLARHGRCVAATTRLGAMGGPAPVLLALWGPGEVAAAGGSLADEDLSRVLRSAMPVLGDRLRLALGGGGERSPWLSEREQRVLDLLTRGMSVPDIAELTGRSPHTVHDCVKSLHRKLGTPSRGALVARALGYAGDRACDTRRPEAAPGCTPTRPMFAFRTGGRTAYVDHWFV